MDARVSLERLDVDSYATWSVRMRFALISEGLWTITFSCGKVGGGETRTSEQAHNSLFDRCRDRPRPVTGQPTTAFSRARHEFFMPTLLREVEDDERLNFPPGKLEGV